MENSTSSIVTGGRILTPRKGIIIENPFTFKVGQVFTGFGVGCGLGIGVGRPLNLGAIPVLNQVMSAASGATYAFSGIGRHVNDSLNKLGAKNIEAGIGCGVGFGHGFGVGLAVKPGVVHQMQSYVFQAVGKLMMKFGIPNLSVGQPVLPASVQSGMSMITEPATQQLGNFTDLGRKVPSAIHGQYGDMNLSKASAYENRGSQGASLHSSFSSQSEKLINSFLQNPALREVDSELNAMAGQLESENRMLHMVLKHQQIIEELMEENDKLRQILVEELKIPQSKLQPSYSGRNRYPCSDCFECRRKQRRR